MSQQTLQTVFGSIGLREAGGRIVALDWEPAKGASSALLDEGLRQISDYLAGRRRAFELPLDFLPGLAGEVQRAMLDIPYGETRTYGDIARLVGAPAQAVGQACGANPLPILIPCHRVTGTNWFGGFSAPGGVETKAALLRHEGALLI